MRTFRDSILRMSPPWLNEWVGSRLLYSMGVQLDALGDRLVEGIKAKWPDYAAANLPESLALIGRDRRIEANPGESPATHAARLTRWLDDWALAGNAYTIMRQLRAYLGPGVRLRVVNDDGAWRTLNADGSVEYARTSWNWGGSGISRFWVIIYPPSSLWVHGPLIGGAGLWAGAIGSTGYTIGSTATPEQVRAVRAIVTKWKSAASRCERVIVAFDPASFDPAAPEPDGGWLNHMTASGDPRTAARLSTARYWRGTS